MLTILHGDALTQLKTLESESVQTCVTSPPYWGLRDYGVDGQIGLESTPEAYVAALVDVFREVRRVLRKDGTLWLNLGDSYAHEGKGTNNGRDKSSLAGLATQDQFPLKQSHWPKGCKRKDLVGIPWMVAFALRADGWYLRSDIIWAKPNPMPESVTDRPTKAHEYIFLLAKSQKYYYDADAIAEPAAYDGRKDEQFKGSIKNYDGVMPNGQPQSFAQNGHPRWNKDGDGNRIRNKRTVWTIPTQSFSDAHFATFPPALITPCILAGAPVGGVVLDPFAGSGTTGKVAIELGRKAILIEPKAEYVEMIERRCKTNIGLPFTQDACDTRDNNRSLELSGVSP